MLASIQAFLYQIALSFDLPILDWIQSSMRSDLLDQVMPVITHFGSAGSLIALAVVLLLFPKTRKLGLGMGLAMTFGLLLCNITLKPLIARIRPYDMQAELGIAIQLLVDRMHDFSFPSGHTIAMFEVATVMVKHSKKLGIPALILAAIVAFSRLYLYVHYPTDVLFSVVAGTLFGLLGYALAQKTNLGPRKKGKYEKV